MLPETLQRGQGPRQPGGARLRVRRHLHFELAAHHFRHQGFHLRIALEHVEELLGLDDRAIEVGLHLKRHGEDGLLDPRTKRIGVVGEVVQDAQSGAHVKDRHPGPGSERFEISHRHGPNAHAELRRRVELVQHEGRDVARRPRSECHAVGEHAGWQGESRRLEGRPAVVLEERNGAGLAVFLDAEVLDPQIGDRMPLPVEGRDGQLHQSRGGAKRRRLLLRRQREERRNDHPCAHAVTLPLGNHAERSPLRGRRWCKTRER